MSTFIECPVCTLTSQNIKYYVCLNGHNICGKCLSKISVCPICKGSYSCPPTRNLVIEQMIAGDPTISIPCKNQEQGCEYEGPKAMRQLHEQEECQFHLVHCPTPACGVQMIIRNVDAHLREMKEGLFNNSNDGFVRNNLMVTVSDFDTGNSWQPLVVTYDTLQFFCCASADQTSNALFLHVEVKGSEAVAKRYSVHIQLGSENATALNWLGPIYSITVSKADILQDKKCLKVPRQLIEAMLTEENLPEDYKTDGYTHKLHMRWRIRFNEIQ